MADHSNSGFGRHDASGLATVVMRMSLRKGGRLHSLWLNSFAEQYVTARRCCVVRPCDLNWRSLITGRGMPALGWGEGHFLRRTPMFVW